MLRESIKLLPIPAVCRRAASSPRADAAESIVAGGARSRTDPTSRLAVAAPPGPRDSGMPKRRQRLKETSTCPAWYDPASSSSDCSPRS